MIITVYDSFETRYGELDTRKSREYINIAELTIDHNMLRFRNEKGDEVVIVFDKDRQIKVEQVL